MLTGGGGGGGGGRGGGVCMFDYALNEQVYLLICFYALILLYV